MNFDHYKERYLKSFYIFGAISLFIPLIVFLDTVAPTVAFWDCGEFITCSYTMGVPHPPGSPLFLLIGRIFTLIPAIGDIAYRVNLISVFSSVFTVVLLYLTIVRLIRKWWKEESFIVYFSACIGALSFTFSDTFWFNAVEAEVYSLSIFLTALVLYLAILWMDYHKEYQSVRFLMFAVYIFGIGTGLHLLNLLLIPSILILIFITDKKLLLSLNLWIVVPVLVVIGVSIYFIVYVRSGLNPVIDENNPENLTNFLKYIKREQYGTESLFLNIFDRAAPFWEYQIKKLNIRYFAWNFIGEGTTPAIDRGAAEVLSFRGLYGLPFLLGILGMIHHFIRDWKRASAVFVMFLLTGIAITVYLNQPDPQPRERDYVFVGSYYAFAIWMGMGMQFIFEIVKKIFDSFRSSMKSALYISGALVLIVVPINMAKFNYESQDRSGNYMPWDYSYNILQSCEENALLFTNGDNDTFPLWYLQEIEGVRKDVKIINLSLLNTDWYIMQLKHQLRVPVTLPDRTIEDIRLFPWEKEQTVTINVPEQAYRRYYNNLSDVQKKRISATPGNVTIKLKPTFMEKFLRVQDYMLIHILISNNWRLPVYFASTVPNESKAGLMEYLRMEGLASKIMPFKGSYGSSERLKENLMNGFRYRNLDNPDVFYDHMSEGLVLNLRSAFLQLAFLLDSEGRKVEANRSFEFMDEKLPEDYIPTHDYRTILEIGKIYNRVGNIDKFKEKLKLVTERYGRDPRIKVEIAQHYQYLLKEFDTAEKLMMEVKNKIPRDPMPYSTLVQLYGETKDYGKGIKILEEWLSMFPNDNNAQKTLNEFRANLKSTK